MPPSRTPMLASVSKGVTPCTPMLSYLKNGKQLKNYVFFCHKSLALRNKDVTIRKADATVNDGNSNRLAACSKTAALNTWKRRRRVKNMEQETLFSLVEKLSFKRCAGTEEEKQAAKILQEAIEQAGGTVTYMPFAIPEDKLKSHMVKVTAPYEQEIAAIPFGLSGCLPEGGADLKFFYAERGEKEDYLGKKDLSDTVVLVNQLKPEVYELLCEKKAAAFLVMSGKYYDTLESSSTYRRNLRPVHLEKGKIPSFLISAADAMTLVKDEVTKLHLELQQEETEAESQDLLAVIPGTEQPEESIVLTAHYDSVPVGTGSWDNATGAAVLVYIYRYFLNHPPKRTMRFVWCGSEEIGLCGSKAYIEQQKEAMKEIRFGFNFDMCGTILGMNKVIVTGGKELENFASQFCKELGYSAFVAVGVHSSDSAPFADEGIPCLGIVRETETAEIHTMRDVMDTLSEKQWIANGDFAVQMISRVANAAILPVEMGMDEAMKKELDDYFHRKNEEKKA